MDVTGSVCSDLQAAAAAVAAAANKASTTQHQKVLKHQQHNTA
jgi:hypothetical protein